MSETKAREKKPWRCLSCQHWNWDTELVCVTCGSGKPVALAAPIHTHPLVGHGFIHGCPACESESCVPALPETRFSGMNETELANIEAATAPASAPQKSTCTCPEKVWTSDGSGLNESTCEVDHEGAGAKQELKPEREGDLLLAVRRFLEHDGSAGSRNYDAHEIFEARADMLRLSAHTRPVAPVPQKCKRCLAGERREFYQNGVYGLAKWWHFDTVGITGICTSPPTKPPVVAPVSAPQKDWFDDYTSGGAGVEQESPKPTWSERMAKVHPCGHTEAQHEYYISKELELEVCPVVARPHK